MEKKQVGVTVRIPLAMESMVNDSESKWNQLERHARECPIAHMSSGYVFLQELRSYSYPEMSVEDAERVRIHWTKFQDAEVEVFPWEPHGPYDTKEELEEAIEQYLST